MKMNRFLLILVIAAIAIGFAACKLPASTPPSPASPTAGQGVNVPSTQTMGLFETIATQTALAAMGGQPGGQTPSGGTNVTEVPPVTLATLTSVPQQPGAQPTANPGAQPPAQPTAQPAAPTAAPPSAPVVTVPPPTPGLPQTYTMQKGEYPYCIARRFNLNPAELLSLNGLGTNTMISPGYTIKIPQTGHTFPGSRSLHSHPTTYRVSAADTIYSVACYFGDVDPMVIAQVNGISSPYNLSSGQSLQIP